VPPCPYLWADVCPPHDGRLYAIVFVIVLQCFPSTPPACAGWPSHTQATVPLPAAPRRSSPSPVLPTLCVLHAHAPVRAPAARHVRLVPQAVLHGMPLVVPTTCPPRGAPHLSTTPVSPGVRPRPGVPICLRVHCRPRARVQGCAAGVLASLLEHGVRTYGRPGCVPTGDAPRTYGRRFSMQSYTKQSVMHPRL
jgi:hypothetical protein